MARTKQFPENQGNISSRMASMSLFTVISMPIVLSILEAEGKKSKRERKLPANVLVMLIIFMAIYPDYNTRGVFEAMRSDLFPGLSDGRSLDVGEVAISQARQRLGAKVMEKLFQKVCRPMATRETKGAWYRGWRLMAIDGSEVDLPDEARILQEYPKHSNDKGEYPYPQMKYAALMEVGSRAYTAVSIGNDGASEMSLAAEVEGSLEEGMLLLGDRYYAGVENALRVSEHGASFLFRVRGNVRLKPVKRLRDGSYLAVLHQGNNKGRGRKSITVRVIEYVVTDKSKKTREPIRLITNILDPDEAPAQELAELYSRRWNIETGFREIKSTLMMRQRTLRSKLPELARQEFWGILLAHYVARRIIHDAAVANGKPPVDISTKNTIHIIKQFAKGKLFFPQA